jgi:hypothetical protein
MQPYPPPPPRPSSPVPWIAAAVVGLAAAGLLGFAVGRSSVTAGSVVTRTVTEATTETAVETRTVQREAAKPEGIRDGTHVVGRDIQPGEYRTAGPVGERPCYWARLSDTTGSSESIVANDNIRGATTVTILPTDGAFETSRCQAWVKVG